MLATSGPVITPSTAYIQVFAEVPHFQTSREPVRKSGFPQLEEKLIGRSLSAINPDTLRKIPERSMPPANRVFGKPLPPTAMNAKQIRVRNMLDHDSTSVEDLRLALPNVKDRNQGVIHGISESSRHSFKRQSVRHVKNPFSREGDGALADLWPSDLCVILGCNRTAAHSHTKEEIAIKIGWTAAAGELLRGHHALNLDISGRRRINWQKSRSKSKILLRTHGRIAADKSSENKKISGLDASDIVNNRGSHPSNLSTAKRSIADKRHTLTSNLVVKDICAVQNASREAAKEVAESKLTDSAVLAVTNQLGSLEINPLMRSIPLLE